MVAKRPVAFIVALVWLFFPGDVSASGPGICSNNKSFSCSSPLDCGGAPCFLPTSGGETLIDQPCVQDVFRGTLNCAADDVVLTDTSYIEIIKGCDFPGDTAIISFVAQFQVTAVNRYDVGVWVAQDGGDARTGVCAVSNFPIIPSPPWIDLDGNACGDIVNSPAFNPLYSSIQNIPVACVDNTGAGALNVRAVLTWKQTPGVCSGPLDALPGTASKCNEISITGLTIPIPGSIIIDKVTDPVGDPTSFSFSLQGGSESINESFTLRDQSAPFERKGLAVGDVPYVVQEETPSGWALSTASCTSSQGHLQDPAGIVLHNGEVVRCSFTNTLSTTPTVTPTPTATPVPFEFVYLEKLWLDNTGAPYPDLPAGLESFVIRAESSVDSATCSYVGALLVCNYSSGPGLRVPVGESYSVSEEGLPPKFTNTGGIGSFVADLTGGYCINGRDGIQENCTHTVRNTDPNGGPAVCGNGIIEVGEQCEPGIPVPPQTEVCNNGLDDNGNGLIDCVDLECQQPHLICTTNCTLRERKACSPLINDPSRLCQPTLRSRGLTTYKLGAMGASDVSLSDITDAGIGLVLSYRGEAKPFFHGRVAPSEIQSLPAGRIAVRHYFSPLTQGLGVGKTLILEKLLSTPSSITGKNRYKFWVEALMSIDWSAPRTTIIQQLHLGDTESFYLDVEWQRQRSGRCLQLRKADFPRG